MLILVMRPLDFSLCNNTDNVQYIFAKPAIKKHVPASGVKIQSTNVLHTYTHIHTAFSQSRQPARGGVS